MQGITKSKGVIANNLFVYFNNPLSKRTVAFAHNGIYLPFATNCVNPLKIVALPHFTSS